MRHLWWLAFPILLDIGIWVAPQLSVNELARRSLPTAEELAPLGTQGKQLLNVMSSFVNDPQTQTNLLSALSLRSWGLPSISGDMQVPLLPGMVTHVIQVPSWEAALGWVMLFSLASLLLGCCLAAFVAQGVRDEPVDVGHALRVGVLAWLRLTLMVVGGTLVLALLLGGALLALYLLLSLVPQVGGVLMSAFLLLALWFATYLGLILFFTMRALVLDEVGVARAVMNSLAVVHRNLLAVILFVSLTNLIQAGLNLVWANFAGNVAGTLPVIVGNAFVSTGLLVASLVFYRDRFVTWREASVQTHVGEGKA